MRCELCGRAVSLVTASLLSAVKFATRLYSWAAGRFIRLPVGLLSCFFLVYLLMLFFTLTFLGCKIILRQDCLLDLSPSHFVLNDLNHLKLLLLVLIYATSFFFFFSDKDKSQPTGKCGHI